MIENGHDTKIRDNPLNENFKKQEFQDLWNRINQRYSYTVKFESPELIEKSADALNANLRVAELTYTTTAGEQDDGLNLDVTETKTKKLKHAQGSSAAYDLVGKIA